MWIRLPKHQLIKLLPVPEKQKQDYRETNFKYILTFRLTYREKTNCNYTTTNINHKQRPHITKHLLTLFSLRYLGSLYHFGRGSKIAPPPRPALVFSRSACPIHFKLGKYLTHKYFQKNQNGTLGHVIFLMTSSYFVKFSEILMKI